MRQNKEMTMNKRKKDGSFGSGCKRILAFALALIMVFTMVDWPQEVYAAETGTEISLEETESVTAEPDATLTDGDDETESVDEAVIDSGSSADDEPEEETTSDEKEESEELKRVRERIAALPSWTEFETYSQAQVSAIKEEVTDIIATLDHLYDIGEIEQEEYDALLEKVIPYYSGDESLTSLKSATKGSGSSTSSGRHYSDTSGNVFLGGNYLEIGISQHGSFGTSKAPDSSWGFHFVSGKQSGGAYLGLISDQDGWDTGSAPKAGDYFTPGSPEECWLLGYTVNGTQRIYRIADRNTYSFNSSMWKSVPVVTDQSSGSTLKAVVVGTTIDNVKITITYSFGVNDLEYKTAVAIENNSGAALSDVRFARSFDPDQDVWYNSTYMTYNKVLANPTTARSGGKTNYAMVVTKGYKSLSGGYFLSFDNRTRASRGVAFSLSTPYASGLWDTAPTPGNTASTSDINSTNGYTKEDNAIAMTTNMGTIAAGKSDHTEYYTSLNPDVSASLNKMVSLIIGTQNGTATYGKASAVTYAIEKDAEDKQYTLGWQGGTPKGITFEKTSSTLFTIKSDGTTPAGTYIFNITDLNNNKISADVVYTVEKGSISLTAECPKLVSRAGKTADVILPTLPGSTSWGKITNNNNPFTVGQVTSSGSDKKVTITSTGISRGTGNLTFNIQIKGDSNYNDGTCTVTVVPYYKTIRTAVKLTLDGNTWNGQSVTLYPAGTKKDGVTLTELGSTPGKYQTLDLEMGEDADNPALYDIYVNDQFTGEQASIPFEDSTDDLNTTVELNLKTLTVTTYLDNVESTDMGSVSLYLSGKKFKDMVLSGTSTYTAFIGETNANEYQIYVAGENSGYTVSNADNSKKLYYSNVQVSITDDVVRSDLAVTLRDKTGKILYTLTRESASGNTQVYSKIIEEDREDSLKDHYVYVNGEDTGAIAHANHADHQAEVNYYTSKVTVNQDSAALKGCQVTLSNGTENYTMTDNGDGTYTYSHTLARMKESGSTSEETDYSVKVVRTGFYVYDHDKATLDSSNKEISLNYCSVKYYKGDSSNASALTLHKQGMVRSGDVIEYPTKPTIEGFTFAFWSKDTWSSAKNATNSSARYDLTAAVTGPLVLYAHYKIPTVTIKNYTKTAADGTVDAKGAYYRMTNLTIDGFAEGDSSIKKVVLDASGVDSITFLSTANITSSDFTASGSAVTVNANASSKDMVTFEFTNAVSMTDAQTYLRNNVVVKPKQSTASTMNIMITDGKGESAATSVTQSKSASGMTQLSGSNGPISLSSGIYYVGSNTSYTATSAGASGITINSSATVYIYIENNCTLTATGAAGSGTKGGGAGIYVPSGATLVLMGSGTIKATGGNAANGSDGKAGEYASSMGYNQSSCSYSSSSYGCYGGDGGAGGGGAGAGIGTPGGSGGAGGTGAARGEGSSSGGEGKKGNAADATGKICIASTLTTTIKGGEHGASGNHGTNPGQNSYLHATLGSSQYCYRSSGGGGGAGGGGYAACAIGTGGAGGGGGGGGANGTHSHVSSGVRNGYGGGGGNGEGYNCTVNSGQSGQTGYNGSGEKNGETGGIGGTASDTKTEVTIDSAKSNVPASSSYRTNTVSYKVTTSTATTPASASYYVYKAGATITLPTYDDTDDSVLFQGWKISKYPCMGSASAAFGTEASLSKLYKEGEVISLTGLEAGNIEFTAVTKKVGGTYANSDQLSIPNTVFVASPAAITYYTYKITTQLDGLATNMGTLTLSDSGSSVTLSGVGGVYTYVSTENTSKKIYIDNVEVGSTDSFSSDKTSSTTIDYESLNIILNNGTVEQVTLGSKNGTVVDLSSGEGVTPQTFQLIRQKSVLNLNLAQDIYLDGANSGYTAKYGETTTIGYQSVTAKFTGNVTVTKAQLCDDEGNFHDMTWDSAQSAWIFYALPNIHTYTLYANGENTEKTTNVTNDTIEVELNNFKSTIQYYQNGQLSDTKNVVMSLTSIPLLSSLTSVKFVWDSLGTYIYSNEEALTGDLSINGKTLVSGFTLGNDLTVNSATAEYVYSTEDETKVTADLPVDETVYYEGDTLTLKSLKKTSENDRIFQGWKVNGSSKTYAPGETYTITAADATAKITITAVYREHSDYQARWIIDGKTSYGTLEEGLAAVNALFDAEDTLIFLQKDATAPTAATLPAGATLYLEGGTKLTVSAGDTFTNKGTIDGDIVDTTTGTITLGSGAALANEDGKLTTLTLSGSGTVTDGTLENVVNGVRVEDAYIAGTYSLAGSGSGCNLTSDGQRTVPGGNIPSGATSAAKIDSIEKAFMGFVKVTYDDTADSYTILLNEDVKITAPLYLSACECTLNLNGKSVTATSAAKTAIKVDGDADLTVTGNGDINGETGGAGIEIIDGTLLVDSKVTVNGGNGTSEDNDTSVSMDGGNGILVSSKVADGTRADLTVKGTINGGSGIGADGKGGIGVYETYQKEGETSSDIKLYGNIYGGASESGEAADDISMAVDSVEELRLVLAKEFDGFTFLNTEDYLNSNNTGDKVSITAGKYYFDPSNPEDSDKYTFDNTKYAAVKGTTSDNRDIWTVKKRLKVTLLARQGENEGTEFAYLEYDDGTPMAVSAVASASLAGKSTLVSCNFTVNYYEKGKTTALSEAPYMPGAYTVKAVTNGKYYGDASLDFTITKAEEHAPQLVGVAETIDDKADGTITGLTTKMEYKLASASTYTDVTDAGMLFADDTYDVRVKETSTHFASNPTTVVIEKGRQLTVTLPETQTGYSLTTDKTSAKWHEQPVLTFKLAAGYSKTSDFAVKVNGSAITLTAGSDGTETYTLPQMETDVTLEVVASGLADTSAPTGDINIGTTSGTKVFRSFINTITFGLFFNEKEEVTVNASDVGSGVKSISHFVAGSDANVTAITTSAALESYLTSNSKSWSTDEAETSKFYVDPDDDYVIYVKIADNYGNVSYLSSDGLIGDDDSPEISGITDGKTYCDTVTFTVSDENLDKVKIDGKTAKAVGGVYTITGDNKSHLIIASDQADNTDTMYTITVNDHHTWKEPTVTWTGYSEAKFDFVCKFDDSHTASQTASGSAITSVVTTKATTTEDGLRTYTAKVTLDGTEYTSTKTEVIDKTGIPTGLSGSNETISKKSDGKISGVNATMEYRKKGDSDYTAVSGIRVTGLSPATYEVRFAETGDYVASDTTEITITKGRKLTVTLPEEQVGYTITSDLTETDWHDQPVLTLTLAAGYSETTDFAVKANGIALTPATSGENSEIYNLSQMEEDTTITVEGVADITAPDGEITLGTSVWNTFLNAVTFGNAFKETKKISITARDAGTGVKSIAYVLIGNNSITSADALETYVTNQGLTWNTAEKSSVSFSIKPNENYVVYAKLTDNVGNVSYLSSEGIIEDNVSPAFVGICSEKSYHSSSASQSFKVQDVCLDTVIAEKDGETISLTADKTEGTTTTFTLPEGTYTKITATDRAGNKSVLTNVTVAQGQDKPTVSNEPYYTPEDGGDPIGPDDPGYPAEFDYDDGPFDVYPTDEDGNTDPTAVPIFTYEYDPDNPGTTDLSFPSGGDEIEIYVGPLDTDGNPTVGPISPDEVPTGTPIYIRVPATDTEPASDFVPYVIPEAATATVIMSYSPEKLAQTSTDQVYVNKTYTLTAAEKEGFTFKQFVNGATGAELTSTDDFDVAATAEANAVTITAKNSDAVLKVTAVYEVVDTENTVVTVPTVTLAQTVEGKSAPGFTYDGSEKVALDPSTLPAEVTLTDGGTTRATLVGNYSYTLSLAEGCVWSDGTTADKTYKWAIYKANTSAPAASYNSTGEKITVTGVDSDRIVEYKYSESGAVTALTESGNATIYPTSDGADGSAVIYGTYYIRTAADDNHYASPWTKVTVGYNTVEPTTNPPTGFENTPTPSVTVTTEVNDTDHIKKIQVRYRKKGANDWIYVDYEIPISNQISYTFPDGIEEGLAYNTDYEYQFDITWEGKTDSDEDDSHTYSDVRRFKTGAETASGSSSTKKKTGTITASIQNAGSVNQTLTLTVESGSSIVASQTITVAAKDIATASPFTGLKTGVYNVVLRNADGTYTETKVIDVSDGSTKTANFKLESGSVRTVVEIIGDTPNVSAGDLGDVVNTATSSTEKANLEIGKNAVELKLTIEEKAEENAEGATAIQALLPSETKAKDVQYLDVSLTKTVISYDSEGQAVDTVTTDIGSSNSQVIEMVIPCKSSFTSVKLYRYHNGQAQALTKLKSKPTGKYVDGTYYYSNGNVFAYASGFSTYALVGTSVSASTGVFLENLDQLEDLDLASNTGSPLSEAADTDSKTRTEGKVKPPKTGDSSDSDGSSRTSDPSRADFLLFEEEESEEEDDKEKEE